jgi:hypothetical protein
MMIIMGCMHAYAACYGFVNVQIIMEVAPWDYVAYA